MFLLCVREISVCVWHWWQHSALVSCSMLILCGLYEWTVCEVGQDGI